MHVNLIILICQSGAKAQVAQCILEDEFDDELMNLLISFFSSQIVNAAEMVGTLLVGTKFGKI